MATSGQINTNTEYDSYFWVKWEQVGNQDIPNNRTQISWSCGVYCGHSFYSNAIKMSGVSINGVLVYSGGTYSNYAKGNHTIASGTLWINHNADGKKTFSISSFTGWLWSNHNYSCNGGSFALTDIPRKATITAASDFTDLDKPSISFSNPGGFTMDVWLEPNPNGEHLCIKKNIPNTGSYTWELTDEERDALRNKCAGKKCTIRLGIYTHIGNSTEHDYADKKFTMTENTATKPTVSMDISLDNGSLPSEFDGLYIQGKSRLNVSLTATGKYGADIASYSAVVDGKRYNSQTFLSDVILSDGPVDIVGDATDSREITGSESQQIEFIPYAKPTVVNIGSENAILCYRSDGNGKRVGNSTSVWIKAKRSYYSVSGKNSCALQWRRKPATEAWDDAKHSWDDLLEAGDTSTNEFSALIPGVEFDLKQAYTVQIRAIDTIGEQDIKPFDVPTQDVALHLGKGGKNVSVGTYCDYDKDYTFYSAWDTVLGKNLEVFGAANGVYIRTIYAGESSIFRIQTRFENWGETETGGKQTFFLFGSRNGTPVLGVCNVSVFGDITWSGGDIVTISKEEDVGVLVFDFGTAIWDIFVVMSPFPFTLKL